MNVLLDKTRKINKLLQYSETVEFGQISKLLSCVANANIYIVAKDGHILGYALTDEFECKIMRRRVIDEGMFPDSYVQWLLRVTETSPNLQQKNGQCSFEEGIQCLFDDKYTTVVPIYGGGERIGTMIMARFSKKFEDEDLVLAEYSATVVGMEILRSKSEKVEEEARKKATVQVALGTLSYSELEAIVHILSELEGNEGLLVASKIADRVGITRSVIVNALRKFESAGVIESKSLGMKGTYIRVLNERLLDELKKMKK